LIVCFTREMYGDFINILEDFLRMVKDCKTNKFTKLKQIG
jgi:hypothetical protein